MKKQPPSRVPNCEHCKKPCLKGIVRNVDGVGTMAAGDVIAATAFTIAEPGGGLASATS